MGWLVDLIKQYPALEVARERLALVAAQHAAVEAELIRVKDENTRLAGELTAAQKLIPTDGFIEARGVLFKRKAAGGVEPDAYCPDCKRALASLEMSIPLNCSKCGFLAPFQRRDLAGIVTMLSTH